MNKRVQVTVDYENNAPEWWAAARLPTNRKDCPKACDPLIGHGPDEVVVSREEARLFRAWAKRFPGWDNGPVYAPTPFTFTEVD